MKIQICIVVLDPVQYTVPAVALSIHPLMCARPTTLHDPKSVRTALREDRDDVLSALCYAMK